MYRYHLNNLPQGFSNYFITNNQIHRYNTRNASKLFKCYKRTNYAKHTLSTTGVNIWNELDQYYNAIDSYNSFKIQVKNHYLLK